MAAVSALASAACLLLSNLDGASSQAAAQIGGRPPAQVEASLCTIADVFGKMGQITTDPDCLSGCAGGTGACPVQWYPSSQDECSPACGRIFEPFVSGPRRAASARAAPPLPTSHGLIRALCLRATTVGPMWRDAHGGAHGWHG